MKKGLIISFCLVAVLFLTGCDQTTKKEKTLKCTMDATLTEGTKTKNVYTVTYAGKYVKLVESVETVVSDSKETLNTFKEAVEEVYSPYKNIKYYDYDITVDGDTLTSKATIDYSKIDTDAMIKVNPAMKTYIKDGKLSVKDVKTIYEQMGAECE